MLDTAIIATTILGLTYAAVSLVLHAIKWSDRYVTRTYPVDADFFISFCEAMDRLDEEDNDQLPELEPVEDDDYFDRPTDEILAAPVDWDLWGTEQLIAQFPAWGMNWNFEEACFNRDEIIQLVDRFIFQQVVSEYCNP